MRRTRLPGLMQPGTFGDMDLVCRAVDRFHRLMRAVTGYVELGRNSRWSVIAAGLTKGVSERLEPKLRDVAPDLNLALRRRDGVDRLDSDQILSALNGIYLLATRARQPRLAGAQRAVRPGLGADRAGARNPCRAAAGAAAGGSPADSIASARLDAALKMAEIRFSQDYADTLRRAKESSSAAPADRRREGAPATGRPWFR